MKFDRLLAALMICSSGASFAKEAPWREEPAAKPDWTSARNRAEAQLKSDLFDPNSATFRWTSGFSWDYTKLGMLTRRRWAWVACLEMNAKNRLGGYVGETGYIVELSENGDLHTDVTSSIESKCGIPSRATPLQAALRSDDHPHGISAAEQLEKLSTLLDKGLITRADFDRQKERLLSAPEG